MAAGISRYNQFDSIYLANHLRFYKKYYFVLILVIVSYGIDKGLVLYNKYLNRTWLSYVADIRYIKTGMYKHEKDKILTVSRL